MNKSTKVWLNRRSKHNWKLKYKRWQNNCFVADDHTGIVITPLPHCNCHWRSVKHWSRQTTQPKPLNADVKKKCTHRFLRLTTFRLWHWIEWTFHELYTKTDGWPPAAGPNQIHSIDILYDHHHHHYRQQRYDMKSHEPMHVIAKIIPKTRFRIVIYLLPPNAHHVRELVRYGDKAKSTFFLKKNQTDRLNRHKQSKSFIQQMDGNQKGLLSKRVHYIPFRIFCIVGTGTFIIWMIGHIAMPWQSFNTFCLFRPTQINAFQFMEHINYSKYVSNTFFLSVKMIPHLKFMIWI